MYDNRTGKVFGFQATMGIRTGVVGGPTEPPLVETFFLLPANKNGIADSVGELTYARTLPGGVDEIMVDRAYSYLVAPHWADKLRSLCVEQVFDMHPNDHGAKLNLRDGYLMIDGWAHCPSTPANLRRIARPATFSPSKLRRDATAEERALRDRHVADLERFNTQNEEREQYEFDKHGKTSAGKNRFKCPARAGKQTRSSTGAARPGKPTTDGGPDPFVHVDLTDNGFEELDRHGNVFRGVPPPHAALP